MFPTVKLLNFTEFTTNFQSGQNERNVCLPLSAWKPVLPIYFDQFCFDKLYYASIGHFKCLAFVIVDNRYFVLTHKASQMQLFCH